MLISPYNLRPYQKEALDNINEAFKTHKRIVWTGATGAGKGILLAEQAIKEANQGKRVLILVHKTEIFNQTVKKLVECGINPGLIQGKEYMLDSQVFISMVQTMAKRVDFFNSNNIKFDFVIGDEFHHFTANDFMKCYDSLDAQVLGLTATPQRTDGVGLKFTGATKLINGAQYEDLLNKEYTGGEIYLTPPLVYFSPMTAQLQKCKRKKKGKDLDKKNENEIFSEKIVVEDCVNLYNKYFKGAPCIIFGASVEDCINVSSRLNAEGWKGGAVYDKMDSEARRELIEGLGNGKYNFLASYEILGEGVDVPVVAGCIKRRRTNSIIIEMQQNGRPARKYPGKKYNLIIDQCGNSLIHGHPLTRRDWTLDGLSPNKEDSDVQMTLCTCGCYLAGRPLICPYCGADLSKSIDTPLEKIQEVPAPMEILPAPAYQGCSDIAEINEYALTDQEKAIYNKIKNGHLTSFDRFGELAKMIGKDRKWTDLVWGKFYR